MMSLADNGAYDSIQNADENFSFDDFLFGIAQIFFKKKEKKKFPKET